MEVRDKSELGAKRSNMNANDRSYGLPDSFVVEVEDDAQVLGLSQTVQTHAKIDLSRRCIVQPSCKDQHEKKGSDVTQVKVGEPLSKVVKTVLESTLLYRYATSAMKCNVLVESFKLLELKFKDILILHGNDLTNTRLMAKLGPVMKKAARKEVTNSLWYMHEPMGVVAQGIRLLYLGRDKIIGNIVFGQHIAQLVGEVEEFFWDVLSEGLFDLNEALTAYEHVGVGKCLTFFSNKENLRRIILEFAYFSAQLKDRNEVGHPLGDHFNHEVRIVAETLLGEFILDDPFCANFQNVAVLSKLNLDHIDWKLPNPVEGDSCSKNLQEEIKEVMLNMAPDEVLESPMGGLLDP